MRDSVAQLGEALIHSQSGHLQILREGYYAAGTRTPEKFLIADSDSLKHRIEGRQDIADVMSRISFSGLLGNGRSDLAIVGEGVEPGKEAKLGTHLRMVAGHALPESAERQIIVGQGVAETLALKVGDQVTMLVNTHDGSLNTAEFEVAGIFESFSNDFDARAVRISLTAAQELLQTSSVNALVISLQRTADTSKAKTALQGLLGNTKLEVRSWMELNDFYDKTVTLYERQFEVFQLIVVVMVVLAVTNTVNMSVFERTAEFGTMMALGSRRSAVFKLILAETAILAIVGSFLGVFLGVLTAAAISAIGIPMPPPPNANVGYVAQIAVVPGVVAGSYCFGVVATLLAGLLPAHRVSRTPIIDALRAAV